MICCPSAHPSARPCWAVAFFANENSVTAAVPAMTPATASAKLPDENAPFSFVANTPAVWSFVAAAIVDSQPRNPSYGMSTSVNTMMSVLFLKPSAYSP